MLYQHKSSGKRVIDPKVANDTTLAMEKVASSSGIALAGGRASAAKTGTVGVANSANSSDAWTVGFTPSVSVASWAGSNTQSPIYNNQGTSMYGRQNPGQAWQLFMNAYLGSSPKQALPTKQEVGAAAASSTPPSSSAPPSSDTPTPTSSAPTTPPSTPTTPTTPTTPPSTPSTPPAAIVTPSH